MVITLVSHTRGPQFEPGRRHFENYAYNIFTVDSSSNRYFGISACLVGVVGYRATLEVPSSNHNFENYVFTFNLTTFSLLIRVQIVILCFYY